MNNIILQDFSISRQDYSKKYRHKSLCVWFTGLSGSGKSTLANSLNNFLFENNIHSYILDGDNIRHGLNNNLSFSGEDRKENIRRIGEVARLFTDAGLIVICSFISPFREDRDNVRSLFSRGDFIEVYVNCPVEICEERDVKGLYNKARNGEIKNFTGIDSPFEPPVNPEIEVRTDKLDLPSSMEKITEYLMNKVKINLNESI